MAKIANAVSQHAPRDALDGLFGCRINIEDVHYVGLMKALCKFIHQMLRARVAMRLEDRVNPMEIAQLRGCKRSANLGRMVAVVIYDSDSAPCTADLKA